MATLGEAFPTLHAALVERFGAAPPVFPDSDPFEAICAVLLARGLGSKKGAAALEALRKAELLAPDRLATTDVVEITDAIAEQGLSVTVAALAPLRRFASWLLHHHDGRIAAIFVPHRSIGSLQGELASIKGISAADADAVLLHALKWPAYPVDRATFRVLVRHGWLDPSATYEETRDLVVDCAACQQGIIDEHDSAENAFLAKILVDLAHGMELVGRRCCLPAAALCDDCPLVGLLPDGGYRAIDE
jgi:endonuclease-3 related protein